MLNQNFILQNIKQVKEACRQKNIDPNVVDEFIRYDGERKKLLAKIEELRARRNKLNQDLKIKPDKKTIAEGRKLKEDISKLEDNLQKTETKRHEAWLYIPNIPSADTPTGDKEEDKLIVRQWGKLPVFSFNAKDHLQLGENLGLIDLLSGAKTAGFRGYYLAKDAVLLDQAVLQYALKKLYDKGFTPFIPPTLCKKQSFINTGHFPWGEKEAYKIQDEKGEDLYLAGTSEVGMISLLQGRTLRKSNLPLKYVALSSCFRREIGSYGKDTRGLYRVHEFKKVEQLIFCQADSNESDSFFEELVKNAEEILQDLELPYRVCQMPSGDMGEPQYKKYDIETWMPSRNSYGETMSCSQMLDFQARRANIKYKDEKGEKRFVYTLNNTAVASPRILIALLEVYQQKDGSIKIPKRLQPFMGKDKIAKPIF